MSSDIHVTSRIGVGSTFWFELEVPVIETGLMALPERLVNGYAGPRKKVLVVDDVAENRAMAVDMVSQLGVAVVEAVHGFDALDKAPVTPADSDFIAIVI